MRLPIMLRSTHERLLRNFIKERDDLLSDYRKLALRAACMSRPCACTAIFTGKDFCEPVLHSVEQVEEWMNLSTDEPGEEK